MTEKEIIASFAGLRPLVKSSNNGATISREHRIHLSGDGVITILGGKYTTYRKIAEEVVDRAVQYLRVTPLPCRTAATPLYGARDNVWNALSENEILDIARKSKISLEQLKRIAGQYGAATGEILEFIKQDAREGEPICPHHPHLWAELSHAIQNEKARSPEDWFERRTSLTYTPGQGRCCFDTVAKRFFK